MSRLVRQALSASICLAFVLFQTNSAQAAPPPQVKTDTLIAPDVIVIEHPLDIVDQLVRAGNFSMADQILTAFERSHLNAAEPLPPRAQVLRGRLLLSGGDLDGAEDLFRLHLEDSNIGVQAHWGLAEVQARQGESPGARRTLWKLDRSSLDRLDRLILDNAIRFLDEKSPWHFYGSFTLEPSTNINQATDADHITLYGAPFKLASSARKKSGTGAFFVVGGEGRIALSDTVPLFAGFWMQHREFEGASFDDTSIHASLGPIIKTGDVEWNPKVTGSRRWYGTVPMTGSAGLLLDAVVPLPYQFTGGLSIGEEYVDFVGPENRDGVRIFSRVAIAHPFRMAEAQAHVGIEQDKSGGTFYANRSINIGVTYRRTVGQQAAISLSADSVFRRFDAPSSAFGRRRKDTRLTTRASVFLPEIKIGRFAPEIGIAYTINTSSLPLFEFDQTRGFLRMVKVH